MRSKIKTETYNKCLVCFKAIANDNKKLLLHWKKYHSENTTKIYTTETKMVNKSQELLKGSRNIQTDTFIASNPGSGEIYVRLAKHHRFV